MSAASGNFSQTTNTGGSSPSASFSKTTKIGGAAHIALQVAYSYKADEERRTARKRVEGKAVFDALGNYTAPDYSATDPQPMTVRELESSLVTVRGLLQDAVVLSRQSSSLKRQALQLQTHVGTIKLEREKTVRVRLDNTLPLHIVCLMHGLPYSAADRLLAINNIRNPNEVSGEIDLLTNGAAISSATVVYRVKEETVEVSNVAFSGTLATFGGEAVEW